MILGKKVQIGDTSCGGFPRLFIETSKETKSCVGLLLTSKDILGENGTPGQFYPRYVGALPSTSPENIEFLLTDWGNSGWEPGTGILWYIKIVNQAGKRVIEKQKLVDGLKLPHTIRRGPDKKFYLGEMHQITSFSLDFGKDKVSVSNRTPVVRNLRPVVCTAEFGEACKGKIGTKMSMHPLAHFLLYDFKGISGLVVNIGAPSDHCAISAGKTECEELESLTTPVNSFAHGASLRFYPFDEKSKSFNANYTVIANGLRNSMLLLQNKVTGDIFQSENARDFKESKRPYEEFNILRRADIENAILRKQVTNFGWPFCYDFKGQSEEWTKDKFNCDPQANPIYRPPHFLVPPHAAPLDGIFYSGKMFPMLKDKLLVTWHGYRSTGHRVVAYDLNDSTKEPVLTSDSANFFEDSSSEVTSSESRPFQPESGFAKQDAKTQHKEIITGWYDSLGFREKGAPVSITEVDDGSLLITEDKNHTVLRIAAFDGTAHDPAPKPPITDTIAHYFNQHKGSEL